MPDMTMTTTSKFPVVDISHKPRRLQHDNIVAAGTKYIDEHSEEFEGDPMSCVPLHNVTIERAIQYYEANAQGEYATLYSTTAKWLRKLLSYGKQAMYTATHEVAESEESAHEASEEKAPETGTPES